MSDNPWLTNDNDAAPLVSPVSNPLAGGGGGGRFGARSAPAPANAFEAPSTGGWDVPPLPAATSAPMSRGAAVLGSASGSYSAGGIEGGDLHAREEALRRKEEELERRFSSLRLREAELGLTKNWPPYFKWVHHDINEDIPIDSGRSVVRHSYRSWLGLALCLLYNLACTSANLRWAGTAGVGQWLLSVIYLLTGLPGAWFGWHSRLYKCCIDDSSSGFIKVLFFYLVHCAFCIVACVSPPVGSNDRSLSGFMPAYKIFVSKTSRPLAIMYIVGGVLWGCESLYSLVVLKKMHALWRGRGHSVNAGASALAAESGMGGPAGRMVAGRM